MNKSIAVLCMYEDLRKGKKLNINDCCNEYKISAATFHRYIAVLREFVWEVKRQEIVYDKFKMEYFLS